MDKKLQISQSVSNEILASAIPLLDNFSYLAGTEGRVYFIDDNLVVKHYTDRYDASCFDAFCREVRGFADKGYSVPYLYAWKHFPKANSGTDSEMYLLEERVKGSVLFQNDMSRIYDRCTSILDERAFYEVVRHSKEYPELFSAIVREYVKLYLETNRALFKLDEKEIERFIMSYFKMDLEGRYSIVDVQPSNIMFDGKNLTHIDSAYLEKEKDMKVSVASTSSKVLTDMVGIFNENTLVPIQIRRCLSGQEALTTLRRENTEACFYAMRRFIKTAKEYLGTSRVDKYDSWAIEGVAKDLFNEKQAKEICSEFERE